MILSLEHLKIGLLDHFPVDMRTLKLLPALEEPEPDDDGKQSNGNNADIVHGLGRDRQSRRHAHKDSQHYDPENRKDIADVAESAQVQISWG